jgi:hypothetical protein
LLSFCSVREQEEAADGRARGGRRRGGGLKNHQHGSEERAAGLKPPRYWGEDKTCRIGKGRAKRRVIGWIATITCVSLAWPIITVNNNYLSDIIRTVMEEVEGIERVTWVLIRLICLRRLRKGRKPTLKKTRVGTLRLRISQLPALVRSELASRPKCGLRACARLSFSERRPIV